jgi:hypothetical protein
MHETYRMLGREHEVDLEREAAKRDLAVLVKRPTRGEMLGKTQRPRWLALACAKLAELVR